jgi:hypothetical protein
VTLNALTRLAVVVALGFAFGLGTNQLPAPDHFGPMWLAELAAPYAILPFAAGAWTYRGAAAAVVAGLAVELAAFFGYYAELMVDTHSPWTSLLVPHNPWLFFELFGGTVFGYLGHLWWRRRSVVAGLVCAAIPVLEAFVRFLRVDAWVFRRVPTLHFYPSVYPRSLWNVSLWLTEALVGLVLAWAVVRYAASSGPADPSGGDRSGGVGPDRRTTSGGERART